MRAGQDGVVAAERHAAVLGITGVPTFIFDRQYSVSGAQEVETFTRVIDQVVELAAAREVALVTPAELTGRARSHIVDLRGPAVRAARARDRTVS